MKKIVAMIERGDDGSYGVYLPSNDLSFTLIGNGDTVSDAKEDFMTAYEEVKEYYNDEGKSFVELDFTFKYDTASFLEYYSKILSLAGLERLTGINQGQLSHYLTGRRKPSSKTIEKMQSKLHKFGEELKEIEFS